MNITNFEPIEDHDETSKSLNIRAKQGLNFIAKEYVAESAFSSSELN